MPNAMPGSSPNPSFYSRGWNAITLSSRSRFWFHVCVCVRLRLLPVTAGHLLVPWSNLLLFEIGQIKAHVRHGLGSSAIARVLKKPDGSAVRAQAVADVMVELVPTPGWRGERAPGSGRPRCERFSGTGARSRSLRGTSRGENEVVTRNLDCAHGLQNPAGLCASVPTIARGCAHRL